MLTFEKVNKPNGYLTPRPEPSVVDYRDVYGSIMIFDKNKYEYIHQWYPFVEGYSKEFIESILNELDYEPILAIDPFAGSGTTPLNLQQHNIPCYSFEVSPFMHLLAQTKLSEAYNHKELLRIFQQLKEDLKNLNGKNIRELITLPKATTFIEELNEKRDKWILHKEVLDGILELKFAISKVENQLYRNLLKICLASILLDVSNVYRNGKTVSYKKQWKSTNVGKKGVHEKFFDKLLITILPDIEVMPNRLSQTCNKDLCLVGDCRELVEGLSDNQLDLLITSPPYLNSRDYTDIYIVELWCLDLINSYEEMRALRKRTLRSHVQVVHEIKKYPHIPILEKSLSEIEERSKYSWNNGIPDMIKGYFEDIHILLNKLHPKFKANKKGFINVANSAYFGVEIKVDEIIAEIAHINGFIVEEIRIARHLKPSAQQKHLIPFLRESVIVLRS